MLCIDFRKASYVCKHPIKTSQIFPVYCLCLLFNLFNTVFIFLALQGSLKPGTILTSSAGTGQVIRIPATQNVVGTAGNIAQLQMPGGRQVSFLLFGKILPITIRNEWFLDHFTSVKFVCG